MRLSDVATVAPGTAPQWTRVTADGRDAVVFNVFQQPGGNTVAIARGVQGKLEELRRRLPADVKVATWYDQSRLILDSSTSVRDAVLVGIVLAGHVLLLFLRNLRVTVIAALTVPVVLASTVLLLRAMDMSFNIMTLGGMAAAVGLIIDDAIVMVEHVMRRLRRGEGPYEGRVLRAAAEFTRPLAGSSASTIVIFVPLAFLSGVAGAFFKALAVTMASGLVVSFFVSWIAVPLLAVRFLRQKDTAGLDEGPTTRRFHGAYQRIMERLLRRPLWVVVGFAPLLALGYVAYDRTGSGFMPSMDEGGFVLDYRAPSGMSLGETDRLLRQVEEILRATPEVATYSRRTGLQLGGGLTEANEGDFFVQLKPLPRRAIDDVMDEVRGKIERSVPGLEIELTLLMEDLIGDLTAVPQPIEIKLFSDDGRLLRSLAPRVAREIGAIPGVVDVKSGVVLAGDALTVRVDRDKAALEGTTAEAVAKTLTTLVGGAVTGQVRRGPKMVDVRAWLPAEARARAAQIAGLRLRGAD
ncbi:MAG: efflux RND transporter permease subunit, partial [Candidatus Polarisedimenticolia bacterium]